MSYLLIAIVIDRSINALRESLDESNAHRRELKREIAERERTQEQLLHAQKMDAVGKLASGIAHDMNNVLGIILGFAMERDRLNPDLPYDEDAQAMADALEGVELAARRGAAVCSKLLNFSRHDVTHTETFNAVSALRDIQPLLRQLLPSAVQLSIDTPHEDLPIRFDRSQFELALLNLASNARDAMPGGGRCKITLTSQDAATVTLLIEDSGTGMPDELLHRIFEPFFTTKPVDQGTGTWTQRRLRPGEPRRRRYQRAQLSWVRHHVLHRAADGRGRLGASTRITPCGSRTRVVDRRRRQPCAACSSPHWKKQAAT